MPKNSRESIAAIFASALVVALTGCNSGASRDVYQQKMAGEIRILEDQLYEADYHNRVLNDRLERYRSKDSTEGSSPSPTGSAASRNHSAVTPKSSVDSSIPDPIQDDGEIDMDAGFDMDDLDLPAVDTGEPVPAESLEDAGPPIEPIPLSDPESIDLPAPGIPEPPGKEDTTIPPIEPGKILPPPGDGLDEETDVPGKIELPDSVGAVLGTPDQLKVHAGLTSGIEGDDGQNEMTIVIHAIDQQGSTVDLDHFDVDAELSVVLLDPERTASESRIGRWDFSREQVRAMIRREPISAIRVPIQWAGDRPQGDEVLVHVRLRGDEDDMRCQRRLVVDKERAIAEWTPRGEDVRR